MAPKHKNSGAENSDMYMYLCVEKKTTTVYVGYSAISICMVSSTHWEPWNISPMDKEGLLYLFSQGNGAYEMLSPCFLKEITNIYSEFIKGQKHSKSYNF